MMHPPEMQFKRFALDFYGITYFPANCSTTRHQGVRDKSGGYAIARHIRATFSIMNVYPHDGGRMQGPLELKKTINLPKTTFSMKANLPQSEPKWLSRWSKSAALLAEQPQFKATQARSRVRTRESTEKPQTLTTKVCATIAVTFGDSAPAPDT
jgi:hypothetical protein